MIEKNSDFSTNQISRILISEIKKALKSIKAFGSVEIYVQDGEVSQITTRNIKKTNNIKSRKDTINIGR